MLFTNTDTKLVKVNSALLEQVKAEYPKYPIVDELETYTNEWGGNTTITLIEDNSIDELARTVKITILRNGKRFIDYGLTTNPNYKNPSDKEGINWASL